MEPQPNPGILLTPQEQKVIIRTLRRARRGMAYCTGSWGPTQLSWWRRQVNKIARYFGIPYRDPGNFKHVEVQFLSETEDAVVVAVLARLCSAPVCSHCGGTDLDVDPAGYYCDAVDHVGAPLLCLSCRK